MIALKDLGVKRDPVAEEPEERPPATRVVIPLTGLRKESDVVRIPPRPERVRVQVSLPKPAQAPPALAKPGRAAPEIKIPDRPQPVEAPEPAEQSGERPRVARSSSLPTLQTPRMKLQTPPTTFGAGRTRASMRRPLNTLPKKRQKTLILLHLLPWLILGVVAARILPTPWRFENWSKNAQAAGIIVFGAYVVLDTFWVIWHVAFRSSGRRLDRI